jgi:hypothetical protein
MLNNSTVKKPTNTPFNQPVSALSNLTKNGVLIVKVSCNLKTLIGRFLLPGAKPQVKLLFLFA